MIAATAVAATAVAATAVAATSDSPSPVMDPSPVAENLPREDADMDSSIEEEPADTLVQDSDFLSFLRQDDVTIEQILQHPTFANTDWMQGGKNEIFRLDPFVGWGGLPKIFRDSSGEFEKGYEKLGASLESLLTKEELQNARRTTLDAHYTSAAIASGMWNALSDMGLRNDSLILEPAIGSGIFAGTRPAALAGSGAMVGCELDPITSSIASLCYPDAYISTMGYEQFPLIREEEQEEDRGFDLVIGNPPFGNQRVFDKDHPEWSGSAPNIHTYFFEKSLHQLRPNGIMAMVVSRYLLDSKSEEHTDWRKRFSLQADLLSAVRLPRTALLKNAGTQVVTDILVFRRKAEPIEAPFTEDGYPDWVYASEEMAYMENGTAVPGNRYYQKNPDAILGTPVLGRGMYEENEPLVLPNERSLNDEVLAKSIQESLVSQLGNARDVFPTEASKDLTYFNPDNSEIETLRRMQEESENYLEGSWFTFQDHLGEQRLAKRRSSLYFGGTLIVEKSNANTIDTEEDAENAEETKPVDDNVLSATRIKRIIGMCDIRDAVKKLLQMQVNPEESEENIERQRAILNEKYDSFVKKNGLLHRSVNARLFAEDPGAGMLQALEMNYETEISATVAKRTGEARRPESAEKSKIFFVRTQYPYQEPDTAENPLDALRISLSQRGKVDAEYMVSLLKNGGWQPENETDDYWNAVIAELSGEILLDPYTEDWLPRSLVLSGNIVDRMAVAERKLSEYPKGSVEFDQWQKTFDELGKVVPEPLSFSQIHFRLGTSWLPQEIMNDFFAKSFGNTMTANYANTLGKWAVTGSPENEKIIRWSSGSETGLVHAESILKTTLNDLPTTIRVKDKDGNYFIHEGDSELLRTRCEELRQEWQAYIEENTFAQDAIEKRFNDIFNKEKLPSYDGSHLDLPGSSSVIKLRPHQKNVVWRGLLGKNLLMDHAVGAGKTFAAIALIMEMKRLGKAKKPLLTVPGHLTEQWREAFLNLYPNANILVSEKGDMNKKGRQTFLGRAAYGDWDVVIVPHSTFTKIPSSPKDQIAYMEKEVDALMQGIHFYEENNDTRSVKFIERKVASLKSKIEKKKESIKGDIGLLNMENCGFDSIFVDEVQAFKNLPFTTQMKNIAGLGNPEGSSRAIDLYIKCLGIKRIRQEESGLVFLTGTPLSNTMAEFYIWQRYLDEKALEDAGLLTFDAWKDTFTSVSREFGFSVTGEYKEKAYLSKFENWPELLKMLDRFKDSISIGDVQRMMQESGQGDLPIPRIAGGAPKIISVEQTELQREIIGYEVGETDEGMPIYNKNSIMNRLDNLPRRPKAGEDNILSLSGELMKVGLDIRTLKRQQNENGEENGLKLVAAANQIADIYKKWDEDKGTQLVFLDFSTPNGKSKLNKETINVIAAIHDLDNLEKRNVSIDGELSEEEMERRDECIEILERYSPSEIDDFRNQGNAEAWSAYQELKNMLMDRGIPENEIAFIHSFEGDKKEELFGKVRSGKVRILMGSSSKMGAGTNVQDRLVGIHHLDAPYRPLDLEQRNGRALRQGNKLLEKYGSDNFAIEVCYYVTEGSGDPGRWQILEFKKNFIDQSKIPLDINSKTRTLEDPSSAAMDPARIKAEASGSKVLMDKVEMSDIVKKESSALQAQKKVNLDIQRQKRNIEKEIERTERWISVIEELLPDARIFLENVKQTLNQKGEDETTDTSEEAETITSAVETAVSEPNSSEPNPSEPSEKKRTKKIEPKFSMECWDNQKKCTVIQKDMTVRDIGIKLHEEAIRTALENYDCDSVFIRKQGNSSQSMDHPIFVFRNKDGRELGSIQLSDENMINNTLSLRYNLYVPEELSKGLDNQGAVDVSGRFFLRSIQLKVDDVKNRNKENNLAEYTISGKIILNALSNLSDLLEKKKSSLRWLNNDLVSVSKEEDRQKLLQKDQEQKEKSLKNKENVLDILEKAMRCGVRKFEMVDNRVEKLEEIFQNETKNRGTQETGTKKENSEMVVEDSKKQGASVQWKLDTLCSIKERLAHWASHREAALDAFRKGKDFVWDKDQEMFVEEPFAKTKRCRENQKFCIVLVYPSKSRHDLFGIVYGNIVS